MKPIGWFPFPRIYFFLILLREVGSSCRSVLLPPNLARKRFFRSDLLATGSFLLGKTQSRDPFTLLPPFPLSLVSGIERCLSKFFFPLCFQTPPPLAGNKDGVDLPLGQDLLAFSSSGTRRIPCLYTPPSFKSRQVRRGPSESLRFCTHYNLW